MSIETAFASEKTNLASSPKNELKQLVLKDFKDGLLKWRIWTMLAYQDIKLRYRRSVLGPFWLTLSMAVTVYSMGYLYSYLFRTNFNAYFPYLVSGMLSWTFISTMITDLAETFTASEGMIKQIKLPYTLYVNRVISRNIIIFMHNMLVMIPVFFLFPSDAKINLYSLFLIPALALIYINSLSFGLILAIIGGRYRDISQIIKSLVQVVFFVTPVLWKPEILPQNKQFIALYNPVYAFLEIIRCPLIGVSPSAHNLLIVGVTTVVSAIAAYFLFLRYHSRIVYWL
jgi:lipopolysaccharide transport system permease protein